MTLAAKYAVRGGERAMNIRFIDNMKRKYADYKATERFRKAQLLEQNG